MSDDIDTVPYLGDFYAKLSAVIDAKTGVAIPDATVTVDILTLAGLATGATGISAIYDAPTAGYWAVIPRTAGLALAQKYLCRGTVVKGALQVPFYQEIVVARFPA